MKNIKLLNLETTDRICASQVIASVRACVCELVENALDAGASSVTVRLRNNGAEIDVVDNGKGVEQSDWDSICLPHTTSKLSTIDSITKETLNTHGFRGQALSAACLLASEFRIITRTAGMDSGYVLAFNSDGSHRSPPEPISRSTGTTVSVAGLFRDSLPVRFIESQKKFKQEVKQICSQMTEYALVNYSKKFELMVDSKVLLNSPGNCCSEYDAFKKIVNGGQLVYFESGPVEVMGNSSGIKFYGWIIPLVRSSSSNAFPASAYTYLNMKPINPIRRVAKVLSGIYAKFDIKKISYILKIEIIENRNFYDVNASVDKRDIIFDPQVEELICDKLETTIQAMAELTVDKKELRSIVFSTQELRPTPAVKRVYVNEATDISKRPRPFGPIAVVPPEGGEVPKAADISPAEPKSFSTNISEDVAIAPVVSSQRTVTSQASSNDNCSEEEMSPLDDAVDSVENPELPDTTIEDVHAIVPVPKTYIEVVPPINFSKEFFSLMEIVGQFNNGFIITRLNRGDLQSDLFLVDQHAANEKFLFEHYYNSIKMIPQILIIPIKLKVKPWVEDIIIEHERELEENGFGIVHTPTSQPGERIKLRTLPTLSGIGFNRSAALTANDFMELVNKLDEVCEYRKQPPGRLELLKSLSSIRTLLASKACRTAVMIGDTLRHNKMIEIVTGLSTLEQPWNCPHGRPTMKHLLNIGELDKFI